MKQAIIFNLKAYLVFISTSVIISSCHKTTKKHNEIVKWDKNKPLEYLIYGLPGPVENDYAENVVANRWGFRYKRVAGCIVTKKLTDSVEQHNIKIKEAMKEKYGGNWHTKFKKEVDEEIAVNKKIIALLKKQSRNINKRIELEREGNGLHYFVTGSKDSSLYNASAEGYETINGKDEWVSFFRYSIDLKKSRVRLLSDSILKL